MVAIIIISFLKLPLIFEGSKTLDIVGQVSLDCGYSPLGYSMMARPSKKPSKLDPMYSFMKIYETPTIFQEYLENYSYQ